MTGKPLIVTVVFLAIPTGGNISVDIRAVSELSRRLASKRDACLFQHHLLELSTVLPLTFGLSYKSSSLGADTKHSPVNLEQAKVGRIESLAVAY